MRSPARRAAVRPASGDVARLERDVLGGLLAAPKTLPVRLLYDETGSRLFEQICTLDEYYLTRAELEILRERADEIASLAGPGCALVEYGSGAGTKVRLLLDALDGPVAYVPIDIARPQLDRVAKELAAAYPHVSVRPTYADYTAPVHLGDLLTGTRRLAFFPGSTIGNFHPAEAALFLARVRRAVGRDGAVVLGVDRHKDPGVLHAAYNDTAGVTAAFNLNVLARLNRELDADFDLSRFVHRAHFDPEASRIEMHLESTARQLVVVADRPIPFERGETIWTESSYKYDRQGLEAIVAAGGFCVHRLWSDDQERFWVAYLTPFGAGAWRQ